MKKFLTFALALVALSSCGLKEEFQPVFTGKYPDPKPARYYTDEDFGRIITIKELAAKYTVGKPLVLGKDGETVIKGVVTTTDKPGNFYKSLYIQDGTGGIELKIGKNGLYNDYLQGQTVYVDCEDLTLAMYGYKSGNYGGMGMVQLGYGSTDSNYESSYLEVPLLIDAHILKGDPTELTTVEPVVISSASDLPNGKTDTQATNSKIGSLVTLKGLKYNKEVFALLYLDSNMEKKNADNRIFLSSSNNAADPTCGITTWAMSKAKMAEYLYSGIWDKCKIGSGSTYFKEEKLDENGNVVYVENEKGEKEPVMTDVDLTVGSYKGDGHYNATRNGHKGIEKAAQAVSQYFTLDGKEVQIRTSGYCKFADSEIDPDVLSGKATIDATGILTIYQGNIQFLVNSLDDIKVNK